LDWGNPPSRTTTERWAASPEPVRIRGLTTEGSTNDRLVAVEDELSSIRSTMNVLTASVSSLESHIRSSNLNPLVPSSVHEARLIRLTSGSLTRLTRIENEGRDVLDYFNSGNLSRGDLNHVLGLISELQSFIQGIAREGRSRSGSPN
jgi:hypothetical protein